MNLDPECRRITNAAEVALSQNNVSEMRDLIWQWKDALAKATPEKQRVNKMTPFLEIVYAAIEKELCEMVKELVQNGARIHMEHITCIFKKRTTTSGQQICIQMFEAILDGGFDVNTEFGSVGDVLLAAVSRNDVLIVEFLLGHGADPNLNLRAERWVSIELAALSAGPEVIDVLLRHGAKLQGRQSLQLAATAGRIEIVEHLLDCGADIDGIGENDDIYDTDRLGTALHNAAMYNKKDVVVMLLRRGTNKRLKDSEGMTAAEIARGKGFMEIVELLE